MIIKAGPQLRGGRTHGLLAYLLGPGRHTDHVDPRIVAGWVPVDFLPGSDVDAAGRVTCRETIRSDGTIRRHPKVAGLAAALEAPVRAVSETMRPVKHVWHCVVQNDPRVDPVLSDEVWAGIAAELVDAVGLAGCRWVAVRHDDHGIHIAATPRQGQAATDAWPQVPISSRPCHRSCLRSEPQARPLRDRH